MPVSLLTCLPRKSLIASLIVFSKGMFPEVSQRYRQVDFIHIPGLCAHGV